MADFGLRIYRFVAKVTGLALGRHPIVESVYANRGVGRGEVSFGRSDIDLSVITRDCHPEGQEGPLLYSLYRWVCALRCANPALTHMMVYDPLDIDRWMRTDTYLGSQERRSMLLLAGKPVATPTVAVRREDAVRWVAFWCDRFFPLAVQQRNGRNLKKIAIEVWKSWVVARGFIAEPYLTLREAVEKAETHEMGPALAKVVREPMRAVEFVMRLAGALHGDLYPPLKKLDETRVYRIPLPPRSKHRVLVILPQPDTPLPDEAFALQSLIVTPELLHLYLHYFNPFLDWFLPAEIRSLGFSPPTPIEFVRACLFYGQGNILKLPGFTRKDAVWLPFSVFAFNQYSLPYLRNGEVPPAMPEEDVLRAISYNRGCADYYLEDYNLLGPKFKEISRSLEKLEVPGTYPC